MTDVFLDSHLIDLRNAFILAMNSFPAYALDDSSLSMSLFFNPHILHLIEHKNSLVPLQPDSRPHPKILFASSFFSHLVFCSVLLSSLQNDTELGSSHGTGSDCYMLQQVSGLGGFVKVFRGFENQKPNRQIPDGLDAIGARR